MGVCCCSGEDGDEWLMRRGWGCVAVRARMGMCSGSGDLEPSWRMGMCCGLESLIQVRMGRVGGSGKDGDVLWIRQGWGCVAVQVKMPDIGRCYGSGKDGDVLQIRRGKVFHRNYFSVQKYRQTLYRCIC
jgi:hypothetical protein